jgi:hypothetical protein
MSGKTKLILITVFFLVLLETGLSVLLTPPLLKWAIERRES